MSELVEYRDHELIGFPDEVFAALKGFADRGELRPEHILSRPTMLLDNRMHVSVRLPVRETAVVPGSRALRLTRWLYEGGVLYLVFGASFALTVAVLTTLTLSVLAFVGMVASAAVTAGAYVVIGLLVLLVLSLGGASRCPGLHCPGC